MVTSAINSQTSQGAPVVAVQHLVKVFKDFWLRGRARAVDDLTFEIRPREVFGLLGPNGSGKSTTIKVLLGLLSPTSGRVAVFGKPPTDVSVKRRIGYLPEESYLYPFLNARETLDYYGKLFGLDPRTRRKRIDELLDMIGLTNAQFRQVREYSKGMQRRIGIAQALINDPDFLILDEPTTGLDPIGTRQVKDLIIELGRRGKTVLLSSHLLADVEDCVDRMVVLYGGNKRAEGTCEALLESQNKTTIEADSLDDDTLAEIDEVIRRRSAGNKSVLRVTRPRQSLEQLFLHIVERARAEQVATSGATHGGQTASFLKGDDTGRDVIERLVAAGADEPADAAAVAAANESLLKGLRHEQTPAAPSAPSRGPAAPAGADTSMIEALLQGDPSKPAGPAPVTQAPASSSAPPPPVRPAKAGPSVDRSVIESLLNNPPEGGAEGSGGASERGDGRSEPPR
ncbi:MAG: Vitamin B12 import ATP-binding protein BtuD [Phycisphaerales bacterium]|nr:Vitamin B12 import ATP-binding protein BtuD [Phycisphaerales bacterium]